MAVRSVVVLNDFCHVQGGASRVAIDEAVALKSAGLDVTFLGAVGPIAPELSAAGSGRSACDSRNCSTPTGIRKHCCRRCGTAMPTGQRNSLLETLDRRQTIVHLHGYTKALTTTPALAARRAGCAVVCTLHDFFAACPNGAFFDYRRQRPCPLRALSAACMLTNCDKRHPAHKAYRMVRGSTQRHVARFPAAVRDYITLSSNPCGCCALTCRPMRDFIACPTSSTSSGPRRSMSVPIVNSWWSGGSTRRRVCCLPRMPLGARGCRSSSSATDRCAADIEATGARVTGWLAADAVRREVEHARCLVFPSLWYETFGLVVDEAAARGVPCHRQRRFRAGRARHRRRYRLDLPERRSRHPRALPAPDARRRCRSRRRRWRPIADTGPTRRIRQHHDAADWPRSMTQRSPTVGPTDRPSDRCRSDLSVVPGHGTTRTGHSLPPPRVRATPLSGPHQYTVVLSRISGRSST